MSVATWCLVLIGACALNGLLGFVVGYLVAEDQISRGVKDRFGDAQ